ncbi:MAG: VOC family protein [Gemmatimonadetes bacterium]|nr:VOC family protein [Gemmatimonadota bacterium]
MPPRERTPGEFCWLNILTAEPAEAHEFFAAVLGWTFVEMPGGSRFQAGGRDAGAMFDLAHPNTPRGARPELGMMIKVADADAAVARVRALGGTARDAWEIPRAGRMSVCADGAGAKFDLWQSMAMTGFTTDEATPGAPCWFELRTRDVEAAIAFYTGLFGWTAEDVSQGAVRYARFLLDGRPVAGVIERDLPPHWITYFTVPDVAAAVHAAISRGGTVTMAPRRAADGRTIAELASPHDVPFAITAG